MDRDLTRKLEEHQSANMLLDLYSDLEFVEPRLSTDSINIIVAALAQKESARLTAEALKDVAAGLQAVATAVAAAGLDISKSLDDIAREVT